MENHLIIWGGRNREKESAHFPGKGTGVVCGQRQSSSGRNCSIKVDLCAVGIGRAPSVPFFYESGHCGKQK